MSSQYLCRRSEIRSASLRREESAGQSQAKVRTFNIVPQNARQGPAVPSRKPTTANARKLNMYPNFARA